MRSLLSAVASLQGLREEARSRARLWAARAGLLMLAGVALAVALVFLSMAFYFFVAGRIAPWQAAALTGLIAAAAAGILLLVSLLLRRRKRRRRADASSEDSRAATDALLEDLLGKGRLRGSDLVIAALVAGVVLGASPSLRRDLANRAAGADERRKRRRQ